jgi:hypothetical protein
LANCHTALMSSEKPADPAQNETWIDGNGDLMVYKGSEWVPYQAVAAGDLFDPSVLVRDED